MRIHKEGYKIIIISLVVFLLINTACFFLLPVLFFYLIFILTLPVQFWIFHFFRNPVRDLKIDDNKIIAPADGKVVVIEKTQETEYLNEERIQISIFMSPLNVHVNRYPVSGNISYYKYHKGKYLVAWHPKSSTENERTTTVITTKKGEKILVRQIAGIMARRIISYVKNNTNVTQGEELGFIRFGSRVDLFLPPDADIKVTINQKVKGNITVIAEL